MASFNERVWALCAKIPKGNVTTYQEIAHALGTRAYRAVGNALNKNPHAPVVPCHRVVKTDGTLGGFADGCAAKEALLRNEGVAFHKGTIVDFDKNCFKFK
ncbi:MAG: MGMT family protein [Candidatus Woesearchaeota archaeon]|nr:MGMT family protein [Candidatus Woesearchaeota archaeon]